MAIPAHLTSEVEKVVDPAVAIKLSELKEQLERAHATQLLLRAVTNHK